MSILYYRTFGSISMVSLTFSLLSGASTILVLSNSIDWPAVAGQDEFKGHTEVSLHYFFGAYLFQGAKKLQMAKNNERATLKHIQDLENERFKTGQLKPVREKVLSRQRDATEYFNNFVKEKDLNFELYA